MLLKGFYTLDGECDCIPCQKRNRRWNRIKFWLYPLLWAIGVITILIVVRVVIK